MVLFSPLTPFILLLQSDSTTPPASLITSLIALLNGIGEYHTWTRIRIVSTD